MSYTLDSRTLSRIGIIGSGQIGPDIALHFAKVLAPFGVSLVVVDIVEEALARGRARFEQKVAKGVDSGAFRTQHAAQMNASVIWTRNYGVLEGADLVIEAATEDLAVKRKIVAQVEPLLSERGILASNSSHLEPHVIFACAERPERTAVVHYFFPAERNIVVEIVPGTATAEKLTDWLLSFYEQIGKAPIQVGSRYGYAIDPVFEGLFLAALLEVERGRGSVKEVDEIARRALGLGVGPFTAMNLTGGNPITAIGLDQYQREVHPWFRTPSQLRAQIARGVPWEVARRGEVVDYTDRQFEEVAAALTGAYFGLVGEIIDAGISNVADMDMAVGAALAIRPPFRWMNELGVDRALELVERYAAEHPQFPVPQCIRERSGRPFEIPVVDATVRDGVTVIKIRRPAVLNALNLEVMRQLRDHLETVERDPSVMGAVITGFGGKAFVSGADIEMLSGLGNAAEGEANSRSFHDTLDFIEGMAKPVVCAYNGFALGGGNELAMACHARLARKGLKILAGQPEVRLGIIPGAGGTQRLPRLVGIPRALEMMRTAKPIDGSTALQWSLIQEEVDGNPVPRAVELVRQYANGERALDRIPTGPMQDVPDRAPRIDLGYLSPRIDEILCRTVLEGCRKPLSEGLRQESSAFGECVETEEMRIGVKNFLENGGRAEPKFFLEKRGPRSGRTVSNLP